MAIGAILQVFLILQAIYTSADRKRLIIEAYRRHGHRFNKAALGRRIGCRRAYINKIIERYEQGEIETDILA